MPTKTDVEAALRVIDGDATRERYFFDHLDSPDWIDPLLEAGRFQHPPEPPTTAAEFGVLAWPDSRYLDRIADQAPGQVADVIRAHLAETRNPVVRADCVSAILKMPPPIASGLAGLVASWVREDATWLLPDLAAQMVTLLAEAETDASVVVFTALFGIEAPAGERSPAGSDSSPTSAPRAVLALGASNYAHLFERCVPALVSSMPTRLVTLLSEWLSNLVRWGRHDATTHWDGSEFWQSQLEIGDPSEPPSMLVKYLRSALLALVSKNPTVADQLVEDLTARGWTIFERLALDVAREVAEQRPDLAGTLLLETARADDAGCSREFTVLARDAFQFLSEGHQAAYLAWAFDGPNEDEARDLLGRGERDAPTPAEIDRYRQREIRDRLAPVSERLPPDLQDQYKQLEDAFGKGQAIQTPVETRSWMGEESPRTPEELRAMLIADLAQFLSTWEPPRDRGQWPPAPTVEGLRGAVEQAVRADPQRYSRGSLGFLGAPWPYLASVVTALRKAVEAEEAVDWPGTLAISEALLEQAFDSAATVSRLSPAEARRYVAQLIDQGLHVGGASIPIELAGRTLALITRLLEDPDPTVDSDAQLVTHDYAPFMISLNTVRGEATHAACRFAVWRVRGERPQGGELVRGSVAELPELASALDRRLDPSVERSLGVRAALGAWFGALVAVDRDWVAERVDGFFPEQPAAAARAGFDAHVMYGQRISAPVFEVMRAKYHDAVARVAGTIATEDSFGPNNPVVRLGEHLTVLYWRGVLELEPAGGLLQQYFVNAQPIVRRNVLEFVGRSLAQTSDPVPADTLGRIQALWDWRLRSIGETAPPEQASELAGLAAWLPARSLASEWCLQQLDVASRLAAAAFTRSLPQVVEWLAQVADKEPARSIEIVERLVEAEHERWDLYAGRKAILGIVRTALAGQQTVARNLAGRVARSMFELGFEEFRSVERNS